MVEINLFGQPQERPRDLGIWARVRFQVEDNGSNAAGTGWVERVLLEGVRKDDSSGYELAIPVKVESWESRPEGDDWQEDGPVWCYWGELEEVS